MHRHPVIWLLRPLRIKVRRRRVRMLTQVELEGHALVVHHFDNWRLFALAVLQRFHAVALQVIVKPKAHLINVIGYYIRQISPVMASVLTKLLLHLLATRLREVLTESCQ
jgi:hypothetical protein